LRIADLLGIGDWWIADLLMMGDLLIVDRSSAKQISKSPTNPQSPINPQSLQSLNLQ